VTAETSVDWDVLLYNGYYKVQNNVWNKKGASGSSSQKMVLETIGGKSAFGWQWSWSGTGGNVVAYPEVVFGDKPWDEKSGISTPLPVRAGSAEITADFDVAVNASGVYNMTFTMWVHSSLQDPKNSIKNEIMIWTVNNGLTPAGSRTGSVTLCGSVWDVYVRKNHVDASGENRQIWTYVAFKARENIFKGPLNLNEFSDYLIGEGLLSAEDYISSVEFGNEVADGKGCTEVTSYSLTVKKR